MKLNEQSKFETLLLNARLLNITQNNHDSYETEHR